MPCQALPAAMLPCSVRVQELIAVAPPPFVILFNRCMCHTTNKHHILQPEIARSCLAAEDHGSQIGKEE